jgi:molybdopterin synthase catalytic subunit
LKTRTHINDKGLGPVIIPVIYYSGYLYLTEMVIVAVFVAALTDCRLTTLSQFTEVVKTNIVIFKHYVFIVTTRKPHDHKSTIKRAY